MNESNDGAHRDRNSSRTSPSAAGPPPASTDAKRRAPANRIGARGEAAFAYLASQQGLLPTKLQEDVGLDFICQIDEDPLSRRSSTIAPMVVGVSVRSTTNAQGRIVLYRSDAADLLRADFPVCVVLLQEDGPSDTAWFAPVDADFRDRLLAFLASYENSLSLTPAACRPWSDLPAWVATAVAPGSTEQEKIRAAERRLGRAITDVSLEVRRDARGSLTVVTAMDLYAYFSILDDNDRYTLYEATFGAAHRASSRIGQLALKHLKQELVSELAHLPSPFVLRGFTSADHCVLRVEGPKGTGECAFVKSSNGEHTGWCRGSGFALTASRRKQEGDLWVHELSAFADPDEQIDLSADEDLLSFLACCVPGARIGEPGTRDLPFLVEQFDTLPFYGWFAAYFRRARTLRGWSSSIAMLNDAVEEETLNTMAWLAALSDTPTRVARIAFSLEADSEPDRRATFRLPVLTNTARVSVIAWLECGGLVLLDGDGQGLRGLTIDDVHSVELEVQDRHDKRTTDPEFLIAPRLMIARGHRGFYKLNLTEQTTTMPPV